MPGKVNPVVPEAVNMVAAHVIGLDTAIAVAALNGSLELNTMMPLIAYDLLESIEILGNACAVMAEKCVQGIRANRARCRDYAERSAAVITALAPAIGYDAAAEIFKDSLARGVSIRQAVLDAGVVPADKLDEVLDLLKLTQGGRA
jgi:aspartate ammonia-lyase